MQQTLLDNSYIDHKSVAKPFGNSYKNHEKLQTLLDNLYTNYKNVESQLDNSYTNHKKKDTKTICDSYKINKNVTNPAG